MNLGFDLQASRSFVRRRIANNLRKDFGYLLAIGPLMGSELRAVMKLR